jgi:hypothetical protein
MKTIFLPAMLLAAATTFATAPATDPTTRPDTSRGDKMLADYFRNETELLASRCLADIHTADDWNQHKEEYRRQLLEMLGLWPMPEKSDLHPTVTGKIDSDEFTVERLHFQSLPHLYVTANLYLPKKLDKPAPAILYVCGHSHMKVKNISFGNKTGYQHHGEWFARNGYVCLIIDTVELGEIEGIHHGTYNLGMWWWQSRGYTPAGVETWDGIRALDYLCSRPEVDKDRIGITGRSGGGAYSWYIAAVDDRIKVAAPVAGITDLKNHVVDGCVEGHCDCMYMNNTYRWDYGQVAALISPRPLLIGNSDKDSIFPLDGVSHIHQQVRRIYKLQGAEKNLGLLITEGPHKDTQDLQVPVFRWFNRFLKNDTGTIDKVATKFFEPAQLRVFDHLPQDQINTRIQDTFVPMAPPPVIPESAEKWAQMRDGWLAKLREKVFAGWPKEGAPPPHQLSRAVVHNDVAMGTMEWTPQHDVHLRCYVTMLGEMMGKPLPRSIIIEVLDEPEWEQWLSQARSEFADVLRDEPPTPIEPNGFAAIRKRMEAGSAMIIWLAPRGVGATAFTADRKKRTALLRRYALLGQTLDGMRVLDLCGGFHRDQKPFVWNQNGAADATEPPSITVEASGRMAGIVVYATLFQPEKVRLILHHPPTSHRDGPELLNVLQFMDMPQAIAMAAEHAQVTIDGANEADWAYPLAVAKALKWNEDCVRITK